jgi:preprotein translocase subunit YajC
MSTSYSKIESCGASTLRNSTNVRQELIVASANNTIITIILIAGLFALTWWSSHKMKKQQGEVKDFRKSLKPGELVLTVSGVIGKVVSIDTKYEEVVIDSDGTLLRFVFPAIKQEYIRPAFIDDDEVDEQGNPIKRDFEAQNQDENDAKVVQKSFASEASSEQES